MAQRNRRRKRPIIIALKVLAGLVGLLALTAAGFIVNTMNYARWDASRARRAGFVKKTVAVNGSTLAYAEGPANGPPLLLIHGQVTDRQNWNRVLPELSQHFHVFVVDCYGHGDSEWIPGKYTAKALADDLELFLDQVGGEPTFVAGHSSGGLIAAALAADAPEKVIGVVLEDPPFFSSVLPRAEQTFNYVDLSSTTHRFLGSNETDFTAFYVRDAAIWELFKGGKEWIQTQALKYRETHPDEPLKLYFMPPAINEAVRAMDAYDPRFGEAFYTGSFHQGFDHAAVLGHIQVPAVLIHANWSYDEQGILLAAMDADEAERARSLIGDVEFIRVDTGHGFHFEDPDRFIRIMVGFKQRLAN